MYRSPTKYVRKKNIIMFFNQCLRARCPSIFSSIAIELNVPRDDFSLIAIELTFVVLGHRFKNATSVLYDICAPGTRMFLSPITSLDICIPGWCYGCV